MVTSMQFDTRHTDAIHDAQIDFYGSLVATASSDKSVKIFNLKDQKLPQLITNLYGHKGPVWRVCWAHPKFGKIVASCGYARQVCVWREETSGTWTTLLNDCSFSAPVNHVEFAPSEFGLTLAAAVSDGTVAFYHFDGAEWHKQSMLVHNFCASSLSMASFSPSQPLRIATSGNDNFVKFWRIGSESVQKGEESPLQISTDLLAEKVTTPNKGASGIMEEEPCDSEEGHTDWVRDVAWAPNFCGGKEKVASCSEDGSVKIWSKSDGKWKVIETIELNASLRCVSWNPLGNTLSVTANDNRVWLLRRDCQTENGWKVVDSFEAGCT